MLKQETFSLTRQDEYEIYVQLEDTIVPLIAWSSKTMFDSCRDSDLE